MIGTRLPDGEQPRNPGEYAWMPYAGWKHRPSWLTGDGEWWICDPTGGHGAIRHENHTWEIHEDETVTFSPSLVMPSGWHGWLQKGVFSGA